MERSIEQHTIIAPGFYDALWSGYYIVIIFENGNKSESIKMNSGVRGINCKCQVEVKDDGYVYIQ